MLSVAGSNNIIMINIYIALFFEITQGAVLHTYEIYNCKQRYIQLRIKHTVKEMIKSTEVTIHVTGESPNVCELIHVYVSVNTHLHAFDNLLNIH